MHPTGRLLWKESASVLPLALVLSLSVLAARVIDAAVGELWFNSAHALSNFFGILAPFAFALGAAALLVTQEFELGTIYWLRSQPIGWLRVLSVKLAVSLLGLVVVWGVTLVCWAIGGHESLLADEPAWASAWGPYLALNSLQVLFWAFLAALVGRGSLASLFMVVPAAFVAMTVSWSLAALVSGASFDAGNPGGEGGGALLTILGLLCLALLAAVYRVAGRRLVGSGRLRERSEQPSKSAAASRAFYRTPTESSSRTAPSQLRALLWHHAMSWPGMRAMLFVSALLAVALVHIGLSRGAGPLDWQLPVGMFLAVALAGAAGASAMAPENDRGRQRFFADHGVRPAAVWGTRLVLPVLILLPLCIGAWVLHLGERDFHPHNVMEVFALLSAFAAGVLAGQIAARPVVGMLSGALLGLFATGVAGFFMALYPTAWWAYLPGLLIVFGLSLRLARRWLDGRRGWGLYARAVGWLAAAAAVVLGVIVPARMSGLPELDPTRLVSEAESQRQAMLRLPGEGIFVEPGEWEDWRETLRQGPLGERFDHHAGLASILSNRSASGFPATEVVPGATPEDFWLAHQEPLDGIAAAIMRADGPFYVSWPSILALRLAADGALEAGHRDRSVVYLTALLRAAAEQFRSRERAWDLRYWHDGLRSIIDLMDEIERFAFAADVSLETREAIREALRERPSYRITVRSSLLVGWLLNTEMIEEGGTADVAWFRHSVPYRHSQLRLLVLPWERTRSKRWLTAATLRELEVLDERPEELWIDRRERMEMWSLAMGFGGPGAEQVGVDELQSVPSQAVELAIAADQQAAQLLERLEQASGAEA